MTRAKNPPEKITIDSKMEGFRFESLDCINLYNSKNANQMSLDEENTMPSLSQKITKIEKSYFIARSFQNQCNSSPACLSAEAIAFVNRNQENVFQL